MLQKALLLMDVFILVYFYEKFKRSFDDKYGNTVFTSQIELNQDSNQTIYTNIRQ